jgi:hypothetical protein
MFWRFHSVIRWYHCFSPVYGMLQMRKGHGQGAEGKRKGPASCRVSSQTRAHAIILRQNSFLLRVTSVSFILQAFK